MISYFSSQWGADPSSDIIRMAQSYITARKNASLMLAPAHPLFNLNGLQEYDFRNTSSSGNTQTIASLTEMAEFFNFYFSTWNRKQTKTSSDELVLQIDNAHHQIDSGQCAPAPLNYYRYILETRYWKKVTLINWGHDKNPVSEQLLASYPKIKKFEGDLLEAWQLLLTAQNAALGASILSQLLAFNSNLKTITAKKRFWLPSYAKRDDFNASDGREVFTIGILNYFEPKQWRSNKLQRQRLLDLPPSSLSDNTRWQFTETERCRSFEFCQSCRDTGPTGTLWRRVIQQRFDVKSLDWDCPHGWKWGGKPNLILGLKKKLKIGTIIKKTTTSLGVRPCLDCIERGKKLDGDKR